VAELFLDVAFIHICAGGQPGAQGMAGEQSKAFLLRQIRADAGCQHGLFNQAGDMFIRQSISGGFTIIAVDALEQGPPFVFVSILA